MKKFKIAYFGTPNFSARFLEKLINDPELKKILEVKFVVTQPDKPVGKKQILTPSPVKVLSEKAKISILNDLGSPPKAEGPTGVKNVVSSFLSGIDLALVCAYGEIIPKTILNIPKYGFWNIHFSLLPQYRGAAPLAYSLLLGDKKTGVTIFVMDEKLDHGPIIAQEEMEILQTDKRLDLETKLNNLAFEMFKQLIVDSKKKAQIPVSVSSFIKATKQNHQLATYAPLLKRIDGYTPLSTLKKALKNEPLTFEELPKIIKEYYLKNPKSKILNPKQTQNPNDQNPKHLRHLNLEHSNLFRVSNLEFRNSSKIIYDYFRGLYPWPGIWTTVNINGVEKRLKIINLKLSNFKNFQTLQFISVQLEGKKEVDFKTFNNAYHIL